MENKQDFTVGSIPKKMALFMLPILGALILQAMYSAVDLWAVGKFGTTAGISGVTTGTSIMNMITFTVVSLTTGVTVQMGKYLGQKRPEKIGKLVGGAIIFFAILGVALTVLVTVFARQIAILMQAPEEAVDGTTQYLRICGAGFIFVVFYNFISSLFRGMGNSRLPLIFVAIACVINVIGDILFVAVFHMNVAGAALATIIAQAVSVMISLIIIRRQKLPFSFTRKDICWNPEIKGFLRIGAPLALQDFLTNLTFLALCAFVNRLGLDCSSGYGVAQRIQAFVMLVPSSIMQSMASFVAQNVGANQPKRAKSAMKVGMLLGAGIGVVIFYLAFFHGDILAEIFTKDEAVIAQAFDFLRGFAPEAVLTSFLFSFMGYFNGNAKSGFVMVQGLCQSFLIRLPMSYWMSIRPNATLMGIGAAAPTATIFGIILCLIYYVYFIKSQKKLTKTEVRS